MAGMRAEAPHGHEWRYGRIECTFADRCDIERRGDHALQVVLQGEPLARGATVEPHDVRVFLPRAHLGDHPVQIRLHGVMQCMRIDANRAAVLDGPGRAHGVSMQRVHGRRGRGS